MKPVDTYSMKSVYTYYANIYVGLREGYDGTVHAYDDVREICQNYVDEAGLGVTVTKTDFVYTGGREPGVIIGLINYPRFPSSPEWVRWHAFTLGKLLLAELKQQRLTIMTPVRSYLLEAGANQYENG